MSKMVEISPKTFPIALAIVGGSIIVAALTLSEQQDSSLRYIAISMGIVFILVAVVLWAWERVNWYRYADSFPYPVSRVN